MDMPTPVNTPAVRAFFIRGLLSVDIFPRTDDITPVPTLITVCGTCFIVFANFIAALRDERHAFDNEIIYFLNKPVSSDVVTVRMCTIIANKTIEYKSEKITLLALDFVTSFIFTLDTF
jgi:hypothetical protein